MRFKKITLSVSLLLCFVTLAIARKDDSPLTTKYDQNDQTARFDSRIVEDGGLQSIRNSVFNDHESSVLYINWADAGFKKSKIFPRTHDLHQTLSNTYPIRSPVKDESTKILIGHTTNQDEVKGARYYVPKESEPKKQNSADADIDANIAVSLQPQAGLRPNKTFKINAVKSKIDAAFGTLTSQISERSSSIQYDGDGACTIGLEYDVAYYLTFRIPHSIYEFWGADFTKNKPLWEEPTVLRRVPSVSHEMDRLKDLGALLESNQLDKLNLVFAIEKEADKSYQPKALTTVRKFRGGQDSFVAGGEMFKERKEAGDYGDYKLYEASILSLLPNISVQLSDRTLKNKDLIIRIVILSMHKAAMRVPTDRLDLRQVKILVGLDASEIKGPFAPGVGKALEGTENFLAISGIVSLPSKK